MRLCLALRVVAVVVLAAVISTSTASRRKSRLSPEERKEVLERLQRDFESHCPIDQPYNNKLPPLADSFTTQLEITHQEDGKHKVVYGLEAFDRTINKGILRYELMEGIILTRPYDVEDVIHYDLVKNESLLISVNTACEDEGQGNCDPSRNCKAESLATMQYRMRELFGLGPKNGDRGYYGVSGVLSWLYTSPYQYSGLAECHGMTCELYTVCFKNGNNTGEIHYYFSTPGWSVDSNRGQVPLAIEVYSTYAIPPYFTRAVRQRYDFFEYIGNVRPDYDVLEPPANVYCRDRVSERDPPETPRFFSYSAEAVSPFTILVPIGDGQTSEMEFTAEFTTHVYYDWDSKIVTMDYVPWYVLGHEYRYEFETRQVQEFNQGLEYFVYPRLDTCDVRVINNRTSSGDVIVSDNGTVSMMPPWMFEQMDRSWQYNGHHMDRGVEADVWVGQKDVLGPLLHRDYVLYYASPFVIDESVVKNDKPAHYSRRTSRRDKRSSTGPYNSLDQVPMKYEQYLAIFSGGPHVMYNIYDYQTEPPETQYIDISSCYDKDSKIRDFFIELPSDTIDKVHGLKDNLLHATQMVLADTGVISPLRINRPLLDLRDGGVFILFSILPLPSVIGDSDFAKEENDLDSAADSIVSAVHNRDMTIIVHLEGVNSLEPEFIPLQVKSIQEVTRKEHNNYKYNLAQQYGSGDMAGLAIGVLILGAIVGVLVCMGIQRNSGSGGIPRVTMARKAPLSPSNTININSDMTGSDI